MTAVFHVTGNVPTCPQQTSETAAIAAVIILIGALFVRADDNEARTDQLDTEHLFGADIGSKGDSEFMIDSSLSAGKSGGSFADSATDSEINYMAFENFRVVDYRNACLLQHRWGVLMGFRRLSRDLISNTLSGEQEMGAEHLSKAGVGSVLFIAGAIQLFCRSVAIQRNKRGQIRVGLSFRSWSPRAVWPGVVMIVFGAVLSEGTHFG